jgi:hypothetical protein
MRPGGGRGRTRAPAPGTRGRWRPPSRRGLLGIRAIALSTPANGDDPDLSDLVPWIRRVLKLLVEDNRPRLVNVNLPAQPQGIRWTREAVDHYEDQMIAGTDPMGRELYWVHRRPARASCGRHGLLGDRAQLRLDHAASPRPHRPRRARPSCRCGSLPQGRRAAATVEEGIVGGTDVRLEHLNSESIACRATKRICQPAP